MLQEMSPNLSTYLQLELAKMGTLNGDKECFDDVVSLTLLVKEKVFSSKENQRLYGTLNNFKGIRNLEEYARHRMITDEDKVKDMMKWCSEPMATSLTKLPTNLAALATRLFRQNMLGIVGARKFSHPFVLYLQLLKVALRFEAIRDEIYCQIMKMMNGCEEHGDARAKLWALMKLCVERFPPSLALENWLEFFLLKCNRYECLSGLHKTIVRFKAEKDLGKEALER